MIHNDLIAAHQTLINNHQQALKDERDQMVKASAQANKALHEYAQRIAIHQFETEKAMNETMEPALPGPF